MRQNMPKRKVPWWLNEHDFFVASLILKGIDAALEVVGGLVAFFVSPQMLHYIVTALVRRELIEDPNDLVAHTLLKMVHQYVPSVQLFISVYLLAHGIIKIFLVYNLLRNRMWSYPVAIVVFSLFAVYQVYAYIQSPHVSLILLTILDVVVVVLTVLEWRRVSRTKLVRMETERLL